MSASPMIAPTVMRGFSDANGSWKMICMSRRRRACRALSSAVTSLPSNQTSPDGRLDEAQDATAGRGLAAARFPDEPQRFSRREVEAHPVDRVDPLDLALEQPPLDGKLLDEVADLEQLGRH
jgi:hypothetical protein